MDINVQFDGTQRDVVRDIARLVYATHGCSLPDDPMYLWRSQHPTAWPGFQIDHLEKATQAAVAIYQKDEAWR